MAQKILEVLFSNLVWVCAVSAIFPLRVWPEMAIGRCYSANIRCKRSTVDSGPIYGHFGGLRTLDLSTSGIAETESSFWRQKGTR